MFRLIIAAVFLLLACFPSSANVVRPLTSHPGADDLAAACGHAVTWQEGGGYACTKKNCDGKGGNCMISCSQEGDCMGSTPTRTIVVPGLLGSFNNALAQPEPFRLNHVSSTKLRGVCRAVPGTVFGSDGAHYFCANPNCDPGIGPCYIDCDLSACTGGMAKQHEGSITLLAILQNGDSVSHKPDPVQPKSKDSTSGGKGGSSEPPPPPPVIIP